MNILSKAGQGFRLKLFSPGKSVLKIFILKPDLVVLDHLFPEDTGQMNGLEVIREMRKADKDVSIIVLSSQQDENLIPEFLKVGAKQYISKDDYFIDALIESIEAEVGS